MKDKKVKYRLKGHESFILREGWLQKGLKAVKEDAKVFSQNYGADALGVGSNMAKSIRYWLRTSNLIVDEPRKELKLSSLGELIYQKDPFFEDIFTLWIVHNQICCNKEKATSWYMLFNSIEIEEFSKETLYEAIKEKIVEYTGITDLSTRSLSDDCHAMIAMYCNETVKEYDPEDKKKSPFSALQLMKKSMNTYKLVQPDLGSVNEWIFFYLIQRYFLQQNRNSISVDDLLYKEELPGKILHFNRMACNEYLEKLDTLEMISLNLTAGLDMVYQNSEIGLLDILKKYYRQG